MRVGIIFPFSGLASVPCLVAALHALRAAGCQVDVFARDGACAVGIDGISIHAPRMGVGAFVEDTIRQPRGTRRIPEELFDAALGAAIRTWRSRTSLHKLVSRLHRRHRFGWFIGVDPEGLVEAEAWGRRLGVPYAYWSLEILIASELASPHLKRLKRREIRANRGASFTIVQDEARAALLRAENAIPASELALVPNAASGTARRDKQHFAYELLDIPATSFVVLCAGTLAAWSMTEEIVHAASAWPSGIVLVMHSRFDTSADEYVRRVIAAADPARVRLSGRPLCDTEYRALVDSADVGLALYRPTVSERYVYGNLAMMGLSSGKVSAYLQAGLPIIVNRLEGPAGLVDRYGCGEVVDTPDDVGDALTRIATDPDRYSQGAVRCFTQELEFERHFAAVLRRLSTGGPVGAAQ